MVTASRATLWDMASCGPVSMRCCSAALLVVLALAQPAQAQANLTLDVNGAVAGTGGTGTWDTTSLIWFNGATFQAWNNATFDNGIFGGTVGTVTLGTAINVHNLTFNTTGYTVTGGTLTVGGAAPTITTSAGRSRVIIRRAGGKYEPGV